MLVKAAFKLMETSFCWQPPLLLFTPRMVYSLSPFPLPVFCHQGNNTCFYGKCYYCRESEPACAEGEIMEGSLTLWLPDVWPLQKHRHPWGRTYREGKLARLVLAASSPRQHSTSEKKTPTHPAPLPLVQVEQRGIEQWAAWLYVLSWISPSFWETPPHWITNQGSLGHDKVIMSSWVAKEWSVF